LNRREVVRRLARIVGVGVETADLLVHELLSRTLRECRAVARYAGLTGSPDESGARRREQARPRCLAAAACLPGCARLQDARRLCVGLV
jgi:hypothetical protein